MFQKYPHISFKSQLEKIAWITLFWTIIAVFQFLMIYTALLDFDCDLTGINPMDFLQRSIVLGIVASLIGGSLIVFVWEHWLRTRSYGRSLINIFWSYTLIYLAVLLIMDFILPPTEQMDIPIFQQPSLGAALSSLLTLEVIQNYLFWLFTVIVTFIALLVNDKYGPGVFRSFLLGRYFHPKREERIFMFLDLRGSTTIAEKLGEARYFNFLKDVFKDATPAILKSGGAIYQYVGDEIVVSWKKETGSQDAKCLHCFLDIQQAFLEKSAIYKKTYDGLVPEFKAGLHYGFVMVGELGVVKREIAYSGDVLNTTARIQSKCNELGVNILISKYLLDMIDSLPNPFNPRALGEMDLRGKQQAVMLYTV